MDSFKTSFTLLTLVSHRVAIHTRHDTRLERRVLVGEVFNRKVANLFTPASTRRLITVFYIMESPKWRLNAEDLAKWGKNTVVFIAPVVLIYLSSVVSAINLDGFQVDDLKISQVVLGAMILYVANVGLDVFRKLVAEPK